MTENTMIRPRKMIECRHCGRMKFADDICTCELDQPPFEIPSIEDEQYDALSAVTQS